MDTNAYLERIGVARPRYADAAALRELHRAHLTAVPFENLSVHLGEPVSLVGQDLFEKIVLRRRGGFCYELNGAFAILLEELGYAVVRMAARVYAGEDLGPPFDHLALLVSTAQPVDSADTAQPVDTADSAGPWLVDVGFGRHSTYPLRFDDRAGQTDPGGQFTLVDRECGDVDVVCDGRPQYRIERRARSLADFVPTCWWHQTSPESHFTRATICSRIDGDRRISINGRTLVITRGADRTETPLETDEALAAAYQGHFGVVLERLPGQPSGPR